MSTPSGLPRGKAHRDAQDAHPDPVELRALEAERERDHLRELLAELRASHEAQISLLRAGHESQIAEVRERIRAAEADRDAWRDQATRPVGFAAWIAAVLGRK